MKLLFCHDPQADKQADARFIHEAQAAASIGLEHHLLDPEALTKGNVARAVRHVPSYKQETLAIYRGWEMPVRHYDLLYEALLSRGLRLINTPDQYAHTLYLPETLDILGDQTPRTLWFHTDGAVQMPMVMDLLLPFEGRPVVLRDFVHALNHHWDTACYIPSSADRAAVERTMERFIALQGRPVGGWMFREYVPLTPLDDQPALPPHSLEYRIVYLDAEPLATLQYWDTSYEGEAPPLAGFADIARHIQSRFFTLDIAQREDGTWLVIDVGDAQTASLLAHEDARAFFQSIISHLETP